VGWLLLLLCPLLLRWFLGDRLAGWAVAFLIEEGGWGKFAWYLGTKKWWILKKVMNGVSGMSRCRVGLPMLWMGG
jgi:hypothetical protein